MRRNLQYPSTKTLSANAILAKGAFAVGCRTEDGKIVPALSAFKGAGWCPVNVKMTAYSAGAKKFFVWADGVAYSSSTGTGFGELYQIDSKFPFVFDKRDESGVCAYFAGNDFYITHDGKSISTRIFDMPVYGGVFRYGRLFGIDNADAYKLRWSGKGGAFDWEENIDGAGWVNLVTDGGEILDLVNFKDKLCAVRENGLAVISAFGTPENFTVKYADGRTPAAVKSTAAVAGDKLIFCTESGLYFYDGGAVEKVECGLFEDLQNFKFAKALGNEYFLCCESKTLNRGAVLVYNAATGGAYLADCAADALVAHGKIYAYTPSGAYTLKEGGTFSFTSGSLFFSAQRKVLKYVEVEADGEVEIEVSNGVKSRIFGGQFTKIYPKMSGKYFKITVRGKGEVRSLSAYAEVVNAV